MKSLLKQEIVTAKRVIKNRKALYTRHAKLGTNNLAGLNAHIAKFVAALNAGLAVMADDNADQRACNEAYYLLYQLNKSTVKLQKPILTAEQKAAKKLRDYAFKHQDAIRQYAETQYESACDVLYSGCK